MTVRDRVDVIEMSMTWGDRQFLVLLQHFPDAVIDDHRVVDRSSPPTVSTPATMREVERHLGDREQADYRIDVVEGGDEGAGAELHLEAEPDIGADGGHSEHAGEHAAHEQLARNLRTDDRRNLHLHAGLENLLDLLGNGRDLVRAGFDREADDDGLGVVGRRDDAVLETGLDDAFPDRANVERRGARSLDLDAAGEVEAEVEALRDERDRRDREDDRRHDESDPADFHERERLLVGLGLLRTGFIPPHARLLSEPLEGAVPSRTRLIGPCATSWAKKAPSKKSREPVLSKWVRGTSYLKRIQAIWTVIHRFQTPAAPLTRAQRTSDLLIAAVQGESEKVTIAEILDALDARAFGLATLLFAIPSVIPMPPGVPTVVGIALLIVSIQMVAGRAGTLAAEIPVEAGFLAKSAGFGFEKVKPQLEFVEQFARPRLLFLTGRSGRWPSG